MDRPFISLALHQIEFKPILMNEALITPGYHGVCPVCAFPIRTRTMNAAVEAAREHETYQGHAHMGHDLQTPDGAHAHWSHLMNDRKKRGSKRGC